MMRAWQQVLSSLHRSCQIARKVDRHLTFLHTKSRRKKLQSLDVLFSHDSIMPNGTKCFSSEKDVLFSCSKECLLLFLGFICAFCPLGLVCCAEEIAKREYDQPDGDSQRYDSDIAIPGYHETQEGDSQQDDDHADEFFLEILKIGYYEPLWHGQTVVNKK